LLCRVQYLVLAGVCTDICVNTTMRDANDRGFECLLVEDATGATEQQHHDAAVTMVQTEVGEPGTSCACFARRHLQAEARQGASSHRAAFSALSRPARRCSPHGGIHYSWQTPWRRAWESRSVPSKLYVCRGKTNPFNRGYYEHLSMWTNG